MFSYSAYKIVHFVGIFMVIISLGGLVMNSINGGSRQHTGKRFAALTHGIGMFLVLLGGFGLLARLGITTGWPGWIHGKLLIWLLLGIAIAFANRKPQWAKPLWFVILILGGVAAWLAGYKPF